MSNKKNKNSKEISDNQENTYKRQWGSEKDTAPLACLHDVPSDFAIAYSRIAIVLTIIFWLMYISSVVIRQLIDGPQSY